MKVVERILYLVLLESIEAVLFYYKQVFKVNFIPEKEKKMPFWLVFAISQAVKNMNLYNHYNE